MSFESSVSRRVVLKVAAGAGAGLVLGCYATPESSIAITSLKTKKDDKTAKKAGGVFAPNAFLQVDPSGIVTVTITKSDMGQGVRTTLAMIVAEELDVDWNNVRVVQAPGNRDLYGGQGTGGSSSVRSMYKRLSELGASARAMLVSAAAKQWNVDPATCKTEAGHVICGDKKLSFGDLAPNAAALPISEGNGAKPKDVKDYRIIGKPTPRVDNHDVVTGKAMFGLDAHIDGIKYAVIARPSAFGGSAKSFDDSDAKKVPGFIKATKVGSGVAVVADNTWAAIEARKALKVEWDMGPNASVQNDQIRKDLKELVGDHPAAPSGVAKTVEASLDLPYLAHATMEPMNCVANYKIDSITIFVGTQGPDSAQQAIANQFKMDPSKVAVNVMLLGGGFGRRSSTEFVSEAVAISKDNGTPIKLLWTRDDDMRHDHYRPASHHAFKGGLDASGKPIYWSHQMVDAGGGRRRANGGGMGKPDDAGIPYSFENATMSYGAIAAPVPLGAWRSVEHTQTILANEIFIDQMATAAGKDPVEFRMDLIKNDRLKNVLKMAAEKGDWGKALPKGSGRGIACFDGYGSVIAHVAEVSVSPKGEVKVTRLTAVVDCGLAINPRGVEAQIQGASVDAMSTTLKAGITIKDGGVVQTGFYDYPWCQIKDMPHMDVTVLATGGSPGGMGEVGYPSVSPAILNAIFAATGKRISSLPVNPKDLAS